MSQYVSHVGLITVFYSIGFYSVVADGDDDEVSQ